MKRINNLYSYMMSDSNIRKAIQTVCESHRWCPNHRPNRKVLWMETTIDERVKEIREIITNGFEPIKPTLKHRYDRNAKKWRDISEPALYPDQVVHHVLIQALENIMMRGMDPFCCGSVKGRGAHYGVKYIKKWMQNDRNGTHWCLECDIRHFYDSINPNVVMIRLRELIKDYRVLDLCERTMIHGILIGAYYSQWFANTLLQPLDQEIRQCGVKHYVRYMDNFTIFANNKRTMKKALKVIRKWLEKHDLELKDNWQYFKTRKRLPNALGYRFGHTFCLLRKHRLLDIKRQIRTWYKRQGRVSAKFAQSLLSRLGALTHCNSYMFYKKYVPERMQRRLKDVIRRWQRKELTSWNTFLAQYGATA